MLEYDRQIYWPSSEELPDSDDTPVDNELQELITGRTAVSDAEGAYPTS